MWFRDKGAFWAFGWNDRMELLAMYDLETKPQKVQPAHTRQTLPRSRRVTGDAAIALLKKASIASGHQGKKPNALRLMPDRNGPKQRIEGAPDVST